MKDFEFTEDTLERVERWYQEYMARRLAAGFVPNIEQGPGSVVRVGPVPDAPKIEEHELPKGYVIEEDL